MSNTTDADRSRLLVASSIAQLLRAAWEIPEMAPPILDLIDALPARHFHAGRGIVLATLPARLDARWRWSVRPTESEWHGVRVMLAQLENGRDRPSPAP